MLNHVFNNFFKFLGGANMLEDIKKLRMQFEQPGIIMSFAGAFSQGIIEEVGEALRAHIQTRESEKEVITKIFSVFVEMAQNIRNYVKTKENIPDKYAMINSSSIIIIGKSEKGYYLNSANLIENSDVLSLKVHLDKVKRLDKNELKSLYKDILKNTPEGEESAGLGLIDMARKTSENLNYKFEEKDDTFSYFYLEVSL